MVTLNPTPARKIVPMHEPYSVGRGSLHGFADCIEVMGEHGEIAFYARIGPGGLLHPRSSAEALPMYFTGSPFGPQIIGLAWERHGEQERARRE